MHMHESYMENCYTCKLKSLHFGIVPGAARASGSRTYYDKDALSDSLIPSKEEVLDMQHDYRNAPVHEVKLNDEGQPVYES